VTLIIAVLLHDPLAPITEYVVFAVGVGAMLEVVAFVFHVYVLAPIAARFSDCPLQTVLAPVIETLRLFVTVTTALALEEVQPAVLDPITEYVVVITGDTTGPEEYVYVFAPLPLKVNEPPGQIVPLAIETVGVVFTVTLLVAKLALTHPAVLVPITV
jgi:hypothetical protein